MQMTSLVLENIMDDLSTEFPSPLCSFLTARFGREPYDGFFDYTDLKHSARDALRKYLSGTLDLSQTAILSARILDLEAAVENLRMDVCLLEEENHRLGQENYSLRTAASHTRLQKRTSLSLH